MVIVVAMVLTTLTAMAQEPTTKPLAEPIVPTAQPEPEMATEPEGAATAVAEPEGGVATSVAEPEDESASAEIVEPTIEGEQAEIAEPEADKAEDKKAAKKEAKKEKKRSKKSKEPVAVADFTKSWNVRSGARIEVVERTAEQDSLEAVELGRLIDSLVVARQNIEADSVAQSDMQLRIDSLTQRRSTLLPQADSTAVDSMAADSALLDSAALKPRYNWLFRDSLSFSLTTAASVVVPGFAQLYEENYWKIPLEYATVGLSLWGGIRQNNLYKGFEEEFNRLVVTGATQAERTAVQTQMLKHKSYRTLFYGAAVASFMGFLVDGVLNFPSDDVSHIQKASTLSLVCPGAGQIYNGSYWKVPIVVVGLASMVYVIDWNQRGLTRFQQAYNYATDDNDATVSEFPSTSVESLRSIRNSYRRNRDLAIIGTVAVYLVQMADAHIDAHMQAYDISDNLTMNISPHISQTASPSGLANNYGLNLSITF